VPSALGIRQELKDREINQGWPVTGLPEAIHVDSAPEFKSRAFVTGCENGGMPIIYRPAVQPHLGGHIERLMGTMMGAIHLLPGTTLRNPVVRGDYHSANAARMTLRELENYSRNQSSAILLMKLDTFG
jgi:putative transposase